MRLAVLVLLVWVATAMAIADVRPPKGRRGSRTKLVSPTIRPSPFMSKRHVVIVPKGDPRARPPVGRDGLASPPTGDVSKLWRSPATALPPDTQPQLRPRPILRATAGAWCASGAVNVRASPGTSARVLFTTTNLEPVRVTATTETSANGYVWVPVSARNQNGYVAKSLLVACPSTPVPVAPVAGAPPLFKQCAPPAASWNSATLGTCSWTICQKGCAISSVSMYLRKRGLNTDPGQLNTWLKANGGYADGCDLYWGKVDSLGKTRCQGFQSGTYAQACSWISSGYGVILNVENGGHWVLGTGCDGKGNVYVNDPGYNRSYYPYTQVVNRVVYKPV